jgi:hypothetical protein
MRLQPILFLVLKLLSFSCIAQNSTADTSVHSKEITIRKKFNSRQYFMDGQRLNNLEPYLMIYPSSAIEYKKGSRAYTWEAISLVVGAAGVATLFITKNPNTAKFVTFCINLPALFGMIYFKVKSYKHLEQSIKLYNQNIGY